MCQVDILLCARQLETLKAGTKRGSFWVGTVKPFVSEARAVLLLGL